ncbi:hypothetical protein IFM89_010020 [Coptis chinensis]|uniref:Auxin-responsive protein n=1 Tax=Coptis chinensis TaxID=261450 RepID=A0A835LUD8_9MAGN|nr:hypothetical protein IFM89_010020 [Coptis chinensis]
MSPPEGQSGVSIVGSSTSLESVCQNNAGLRERNYMGLSDSSSADSSSISSLSEEKKSCLNMKATELRLGLPGSQSPERNAELCLISSGNLDEKPLFPLLPSKDAIFAPKEKTVTSSGNKRGFSDAMNGFSDVKTNAFAEGNWMFPPSKLETAQSVNTMISSRSSLNLGVTSHNLKDQSGVESSTLKDTLPSKGSHEKPRGANEKNQNQMTVPTNSSIPPAAKAQVVGWPPIRSFRKNTLSTNSKNNEEVDGKPGPGALFVKVSMDGAPYLRKVDLKTYSAYQDLSSALEKMFSCFTIGQCGSHGAPGREVLSESKLRDLLHGSEYVLTYEDKDGDWMLVGDVPWEMFIDSCKRMRIMKGSDAIGLAPRAMEKSRNRN